jgi:hypothetical protein
MKSNKLLTFILAGIIIIALAGAGLLYFADMKEQDKQDSLNSQIASAQATIARSSQQKAEKQAEAVALAAQLVEAKALLEQTGFRTSAESIEYDRLLFQIAADTQLHVNSISATAPLDLKEGNITYQQTTFSISLEGIAPGVIFNAPVDSSSYIDGVVDNILAYVNTLAASPDFDTAQIQSVSISAPEPMTAEDIASMIEDINSQVESELTDAEREGKTEEEITALVQSRLAAKTSAEIAELIEEAGLDKPKASITIKIWTYKGA